MLKCEDIRLQLSAYIDHEVPFREAQVIRWHIRRCHECAYEYMLLMDTSEAMKSLVSVIAPDNFLREVMTKASMMAAYERKKLNLFQRVMRRVEARFAQLRYSFYVFRGKAIVYATALMTLVVLVYFINAFISAMPKIFTPPLSKPHPTLVKAEAKDTNEIITIEFVTPVRLRYMQNR